MSSFVPRTAQNLSAIGCSNCPKEDRVRIGEDIRVVEFGWPIGMPICRPLGGCLYEVRTLLKDRIVRVVFSIMGGDMVLLHGFIKKTRSTPAGDLELARSRLKIYRKQAT